MRWFIWIPAPPKVFSFLQTFIPELISSTYLKILHDFTIIIIIIIIIASFSHQF